jgi:hypothetical protein
MVGIDTEKVFATSSLGIPASTAESTLNLSGLSNMASYSEANTQINTYGHRCNGSLLMTDKAIDKPHQLIRERALYRRNLTSRTATARSHNPLKPYSNKLLRVLLRGCVRRRSFLPV